LTITIPITKHKTQSANSTIILSIKKTNLASSTKEEKKKLPETKSISIKTEPKSIPSGITKNKPLISSSKTSQITKTNQQQKQSSNESVKPTAINKSASSILPFKPKTTQSQTSTNNNNNKDRSGVSKPASTSSSLIDSRQVKSTKINSSSAKTTSQDRSTSAPVKKTKPTINEENITKPLPSTSTMKIPKLSSNNDTT
jgi:hypothetical protein